jgi:hypothetical protein
VYDFQTSTDGGTSFGTDYDYSGHTITDASTEFNNGANADSEIQLTLSTYAVGQGTSEGCSFELTIIDPERAAYTRGWFVLSCTDGGGRNFSVNATFQVPLVSDVDAVRFNFANQNYAAQGSIKMYGIA